MTWHWAHLRLTECDHWWESEGEWHREWKAAVAGGDTARMEVRVAEGDRWHVADALSGDGLVVELQHSPLAPAEVREREEFYTRTMGGMIWVFDYTNKLLGGRDIRVDTAACPRLLDLGNRGVVGLVQGERTEFGRWSATEIRRLLSSSEGVSALCELHNQFVIDREAQRAKEQRLRAEAQAKRIEEQRLREEEQARQEEDQRLRAETRAKQDEQARLLFLKDQLRRCMRVEQQQLEQERKLVKEQQAREAQLQNVKQYQGGEWLFKHSEFTHHIEDIKTMGYVTLKQAIPMFRQYGFVEPTVFPLVDISGSDLDRIERSDSAEKKLESLRPYLNPTSHLRIEVWLDQRRAAKEAALANPMLVAMCDAYTRGDLKEVTRLLSGASKEVQSAYTEYVQVSRRQV